MQTERHEASSLAATVGFARTLSVALILFLVVTVPALDSGVGRTVAAVGAVGCAVVIAYARGSLFYRTDRPYPEVLVLLAWIAFAVAWGFIFPSLDPVSTIPLAFLAVLLAAVAWIWSAARFVGRITLHSLLGVLGAEASFLYFVWAVVQL